jgi:hypothetical protein
MTQHTLSTDFPGEASAARAGRLNLLPWIFAGLGVLAPLVLVTAAALGSDSSAVRAQMIVQGCEMLAVALMATVVLSILYAMGMQEAARITGPGDPGLGNSAAA